MVHVVLVAFCLAVCSPSDPVPPTASDRALYEAVRAKAGHDPAAHVKLALWCEAHGLTAERLKHLAEAISIDSTNVTARGLLGLVAYRGRWLALDEVGEKRRADLSLTKQLEEYRARRAALGASIDATKRDATSLRKAAREHEKLGTWCEQHGLKDEAIAHFTTAVQLDPYRDSAWRHLGYVKRNGRWMSREQIVSLERDASAERKADRYWDPLLKKWRTWLGEQSHHDEAVAALAEVTDPRAVRTIVRVFGAGSPAQQRLAVSMLGRIDDPAASMGLARLALFGDGETVRQAAIEALQGRNLRDFVGPLIEMIHSQVRYKVQHVQGPGSQGALAVATPRFRTLRTYDAPPAFLLGSTFRGYVGYDANGMPFVAAGAELDRIARLPMLGVQVGAMAAIEARTRELLQSANLKAAAAQQQLSSDIDAIESFNSDSAAVNQRIIPVIQKLAGAPDLKDDEDAWHSWWYDHLGYRYEPPPQVTVFQDSYPQLPGPTIYTCFAAGTPVRTPEGLAPIETIRVGDLVLSQDVTTGALDFHPVLVVHHNAPGDTLRISLSNDDTLVSSVYHRFWRPGMGWVLARELKPGETLRSVNGLVRVDSVEPGTTVPLYNLDVAQKRSFFAGKSGMLVHDNTLPPARFLPFDVLPDLNPARARTD
jgi:tetratricopeptide (TPR) repeat protein